MFAVSIVMRFFVDYYEEGKQFPVRDLTSIAKNYLKTDFIFDFIPLIPLQELALPRGYARFFYIIKIFRLFNGFKLLNVEHIMEYIKKFYKSKVDRMIQSDVEIGEDIVRDNNNIRTLLVIKYIIRLAKLFYIIVSICYFLGFTWYIFCELILEHQEAVVNEYGGSSSAAGQGANSAVRLGLDGLHQRCIKEWDDCTAPPSATRRLKSQTSTETTGSNG